MSLSIPRLIVLLSILVLSTTTLIGCNLFANRETSELPPPVQHNSQDVVTVFFSKNQGGKAITEEVVRPLPADQKQQNVRYAVQELLEGPNTEESRQGFYSEIPKGTRLLELTKQDESVHINLSGQFAIGGGSNSMQQRVEELKNTVFSVSPEKKLYLAVDGKPLEILGGEGLELPQPLQPDIQ